MGRMIKSMKIYFDNAKLKTNRGFSVFGRNLLSFLKKHNHADTDDLDKADIHLAFITNSVYSKKVPIVQRLDGVYFYPNSSSMNSSILATYKRAKSVIIQSEFDKKVVVNLFGNHENISVIHNGTNLDVIKNIVVSKPSRFEVYDKIWMSASRWISRPNKRLNENVRYFLEHSGNNDCMFVAGPTDKDIIKHDRVFYFGEMKWEEYIGLLKMSNCFIHLAIADHCPNSVVEARACNCQIICSDLGGTQEIAGPNAIVIKDMDWDYKTPFNYKKPPLLDFSKVVANQYNVSIDINNTGREYLGVFKRVLRK